MKIKIFSTSFQPTQEKYESFVSFENELNEFIATVKVIDIKYSTTAGMCHDAQTHANEFVEDFSAMVLYEDIEADTAETKASAKKNTATNNDPSSN